MSTSPIVPVLVAFAASLVCVLIGVPIAKHWATRLGLVDRPDEKRKLHGKPIPLVGGITLFVMVCLIATIMLSAYAAEAKEAFVARMLQRGTPGNAIAAEWISNQWQLFGLFAASAVILIVGLIDDRFAIRGRQKLLGQILAVTILVVCGYEFSKVSGFGITVNLHIFAVFFIYAWLLGGINSVNLLDGADGFATTIGLMMSAALCVMALHMGRFEDAILAAAAAGAMLGFLRFNFPPASAYLGDSGSMLIGCFVAAMAIRMASKEAAAYAFFAPLALLAIPMFDTLAAIVRRRMTGRSIYSVDRGHLHHALMRRGLSPRTALLWFTALSLTTVLGATLSLTQGDSLYAVVSIAAVVIFLVVGKVFGFSEFKLVSNKAVSVGKSFFSLPRRRRSVQQVSVQLQGDRNWDLSWQVLREFAEKHQLSKLTMDLNVPWIHESFHATYRQADLPRNGHDDWSAELPLQIQGKVIGRLDLTGSAERLSVYDTVAQLIDVLDSLEPYLIQTMKAPTVSEVPMPRARDTIAEPHAARKTTSGAPPQKMLDVG